MTMRNDDISGADELHAGKRRLLLIVGGNALLLIVMLGLPWLRGYLRTRALWSAFGAYGACLFGGTVADEPGLGLPIGHEAYFATRAIGEPGWATQCDDQLSALAPEEATFIMPAVKVAESDLRAAVTLLRNELAPLSARTPGSRLSVRPLRAFERLRAGLANHTNATGAVAVPEGPAFVLPTADDATRTRGATGPFDVMPTPTRLPLYAGASALVSLWGSDVELTALATDQTGISYVHVLDGKLEQTRTPRPKLLEAAVPPGLPSSFVWAMAQSRCAERATGCADKTLGIASVPLPLNELPTPRWLGAHPRGRLDRSLWRRGESIVVVALTGHGATSGSEVREFTLSSEAQATATADMPPLSAARSWPTRPLGDPLVLAAGDRPLVLSAVVATDTTQLIEVAPDSTRTLVELPGEGKGWVVGCAEDGLTRLAFGNDQKLVLAERTQDGVFTSFEPIALALHDVVHERDPACDRVQTLCGLGNRTVSVVLDKRDRLSLVSCQRGVPHCNVDAIASAVRTFAVLARGDRLIAAYAGDAEASQVRVRSMLLSAPDRAEEKVPAVCWSDHRGLCAAPTLARLGERAILAAREGTDMRVLESADEGESWVPLRGLGKRD
jgi:hypothetical protein